MESPFIKRVFLPGFRTSLIVLCLICIVISSWLETNESIDDCAFKNSMSFHQVYLYQNISSNITTPDSVSFGLWKSCYFYALNCTCSPTNLKYQPDIPNLLLQATNQHNAKPLISTETSFSRIIPLMMASISIGVAFLLCLVPYQLSTKRIISGLIFITLLLISIAFGSTFKSYADMIKKTCKDPNNTIYCSKYAYGIELVLFAVAIGVLALAFLFWLSVSIKPINDEPEHHWWDRFKPEDPAILEQQQQEEERIKQRQRQKKANYYYPNASDATMVPYYQQEEQQQQYQEPYYDDHHDYFNNPQPQKNHYHSRQSSPRSQQQQYRSYSNNNKKQRKSSADYYQQNTLQVNNQSPFGGERRGSNTRPLKSKKTPTSMSPHPFSNEANSYYHEDTASSTSNNSSYYQQHVPILKMPPPTMEHPLNKKVITDRRIQSYLQQSNSSNSTF